MTWFRLALANAVLLTLDWAPPPPATAQGAGQDKVFSLGREGWSFERFGKEIVVLRTSVMLPGRPASPQGLLLLSCEAGERRIRIDFPEALLTEQDPVRPATLLVQSSPKRDFLLAQVTLAKGRSINHSEGSRAPTGLVPSFVNLLQAFPERLVLLLNPDTSAPRLGRLVPVVFELAFRPVDRLSFAQFHADCTEK